MPTYDVTRTLQGRTVEHYTVQAHSGLEAIALAPHFNPEAKVAHAFAMDDDHARDASLTQGDHHACILS